MTAVRISELRAHVGETVTVRGWVVTTRSSGKIAFVVLRDGIGLPCKASCPRRRWRTRPGRAFGALTQEASVAVTGAVRDEPALARRVRAGGDRPRAARAPVPTIPIPPKEHGTTFLFEHRHLWLRSRRQVAIARVRHEVEQAIRDFFYQRGLHPGRHADPDRRDRRGGGQPLRHRLLRPGQGLPGADRPALRRGGGGGARQGLLLRPHVPGREVEDPPAPHRVLDGRARGGVQRLRRQHAAAGDRS